MSGLLDHVAKDFDSRMAHRRRMLAHLGIEISDETACEMRRDLRETLLGCGKCRNGKACRRWLDADCAGPPMFCGARDAYLRLEVAAAEARRPRRRAACA